MHRLEQILGRPEVLTLAPAIAPDAVEELSGRERALVERAISHCDRGAMPTIRVAALLPLFVLVLACSDPGGPTTDGGPDTGPGSDTGADLDASAEVSDAGARADAAIDAGGGVMDAELDLDGSDLDAILSTDAGTGDAGATCGRCRAGATCTAGVCRFPCAGIEVPGDYATVQEAITALSTTGRPETICLGPGDHGDVSLGAPITLVGSSPELTSLGTVSAFGTSPAVLRGLRMARFEIQAISGGNARLEGCQVTGGVELLTAASRGAGSIFVVLAGCDLSNDPANTVVAAGVGSGAGSAGMSLTVENSYVHGGRAGIAATVSEESLTVVLRHNTVIDNSALGIYTRQEALGSLSATVVNNLVMDADVALHFDGAVPGTYRNNALFDNVTRYAGLATPAPGTVTEDPRLDESSPPAPLPDSPLLGAASATDATERDYFGASRTSRPDIGAVQGP